MSNASTDPVVLDQHAMRLHLMRCVDHVGGQQALARHLSRHLGRSVSQREISQAVSGQRPVSRRIAAALGFYRSVQPRRVYFEQMPRDF